MYSIRMKKLLIISVTLFLAGCATRKEVVQFKEGMQDLQNQVVSLQSENRELKRQLQEIQRSIERLEEQGSRNRADLLVEMEDLKRQFQFLNQMLEDNMARMSRHGDQTRSHNARIASNSNIDTLSADTTSGDKADQIDAQKLYNTAYTDFTRGNYETARMGFQEFFKRFAHSSLADNAQYWLGEIHYAQQNYEEAIREFRKVGDQYPNGDKVSASLLKIAHSYLRLGDAANGRRYLDEVIQRFPYSEEAKLAQSRLSDMD